MSKQRKRIEGLHEGGPNPHHNTAEPEVHPGRRERHARAKLALRVKLYDQLVGKTPELRRAMHRPGSLQTH